MLIKSLLSVMAILCSQQVFAENTTEIKQLSYAEIKAEYKEEKIEKTDDTPGSLVRETTRVRISVAYQTGGGCQKHSVRLVPTIKILDAYGTGDRRHADILVSFKVYDVTPEYDSCEAIIYMQEDFYIDEVLKDWLAENNLKSHRVTANIVLPTVYTAHLRKDEEIINLSP